MVYSLKFFKKLFILTALITGILHYSFSQEAEAWQNPDSWKNPDIARYLQNAPIIAQEPMGAYLKRNGFKTDFSNKVYVVTFANGAQAVFKPEEYEADPLPYAEEAAYQASLSLGFPHIPPTTIRTIENQTGSLQLFIKTDIDLLKEDAFRSFLQRVDPEEFALLKIFYFVFGQWDTGPGNMLCIERENKVLPVCIDNGTIKYLQIGPYGTMPFVVVSPYSPTKTTIKQLPKLPDKTYRASELLQSDFNLPGDALRHLCKVAEKPYSNKHRRFFLTQQVLWCQYHHNCKKERVILPFSDFLPAKAHKGLEKLDLERLKTIFDKEAQKRFAYDVYLNAILQRRDEVLAYHAEQQT